MKPYIDVQAGQYIDGDAVVDEQPGAHTGVTRKYISNYAANNIIYLDLLSGNDANDGSTELLAKLTYASAATAAGSTKKIRIISNNAALTANVTKPTEMKIGLSGSISGSVTTMVSTWTAQTTGFGGSLVTSAAWSPLLSLYVIVGMAGKLATSPDGVTWTLQTSGFGASSIWAVSWSEAAGVFLAAGDSSKVATSPDGVTWTLHSSVSIPGGGSFFTAFGDRFGKLWVGGDNLGFFVSSDGGSTWSSVACGWDSGRITDMAYSETLGMYCVVGGYSGEGRISTSTDGQNWTVRTNTFTSAAQSVVWAESIGLFIAGATLGEIETSPDGIVWTSRVSALTSDVYAISWAEGLQIAIAADGLGNLVSSPDGVTWTARTSGIAGQINASAYSELLQAFIIAGGSGLLSTSAASGVTVSASVAGFTISNVTYSGTLTLYNCTSPFIGTTAAVSTENCRTTGLTSHIKNNAQGHYGLLADGGLIITATPAAQNAVQLRSCTVAGVASIRNASATYFEQIQDCVFVGGIQAAYGVAVFGGLANGTNVNAVFDGTGTDDPQFIDETDYKPKRAIEGYAQDSPLVAGSLVYLNSLGVARDLGAWSFREENLETKYRRHFAILKPSQKDAIKFQKHLLTSANPTANGTPSVVNVPEAAWEELILQYGSVNTEDKGFLRNQLELLEYMERQENLAVRLSWDGDDAINSLITANGLQAAGSPTITVDETDIEPGVKFLWQGTRYTVMRVSGSVLLLDRDLADEIPDTTEIDLLSPAGYGDYRMILEKDPILTLNHFAQTDYKRGMVLRFARQCP